MTEKKELTLREHLQSIQSLGGKARWAGLTTEERSAAARKAVQARWAKSTGSGTVVGNEKNTTLKPRSKKG